MMEVASRSDDGRSFFLSRGKKSLPKCRIPVAFCLSLALIAGLLLSRAAKVFNLPVVTSYLLAGLLLGPFFLGRLDLTILADPFVLLIGVVYELAGPTLTKIALTAAGEIRPEGRTSARVENKPEEVA